MPDFYAGLTGHRGPTPEELAAEKEAEAARAAQQARLARLQEREAAFGECKRPRRRYGSLEEYANGKPNFGSVWAL